MEFEKIVNLCDTARIDQGDRLKRPNKVNTQLFFVHRQNLLQVDKMVI